MMKRILSIILAVCMLGSLAVVVASAEEKPEKTFNYVALGDSIAAGYGLTAPGTAKDPALVLSEDLIANPVQTAYAQVFGNRLAELGAEYGYATTATNLASTAYRAEDVSKTITTEGYKGLVAAYIFETFVGKGASDMLLPYHDIYNKYLPDADMVSIQLGGNDIVMGIIYPMIEKDNPILNDAALSVALLLFGLSADKAIGAGVQMLIKDKDKITMEHVAEATKFFASIAKNKEQLVLNAAANVEEVVETVKVVNPTADIALIGMYNPYGNSLEYQGQVRDVCNVIQNIFVKGAAEAIDFDINIGGVEIVPADKAEEKTEELDSIADELINTPLSELRKARIQALVTIAAQELAYPIQYLTAGKNVDPQMKLLNEKLQEIAERQGATYVNVYDISNECNSDPHPTAEGHKEIADRLEAAMTEKIIAKMNPAKAVAGDVNGDGVFTIDDVTMTQQYLAEFDVDGIDLDVADFNGDGKVNIGDVTAMQRAIAELA